MVSSSSAVRSQREPLRLVPRGRGVDPPSFVGSSPAVTRLLAEADRLARTELAVVITGESGTGKEVLARRLHESSARAGEAFEVENCAAIPDTLMESEFFGHVRGSFTGADRNHEGVFVRADGGTLFLDEIGDMPLALQGKLLRVLEEGRVRPVGSSTSRGVDVRIICATNQDLLELVEKGKFRLDLYYRLCGASLHISPLRERLEDVEVLAQHFLGGLNRENGTTKRLVGEVLSRFVAYSWPGNVRELRNKVNLIYHLSDGEAIEDAMIRSDACCARQAADTCLVNAVAPLVEIEKDAIRLALEKTGGDREEAARRLGISRSGIYAKIKKYDLALS